MAKKIFISGMHSGQSPSPGIGIARSIRKAFPKAEFDVSLVGVDHWQGSSGLHDACIDDVLILPQWHQIDDSKHAKHIRSHLDEGDIWMSSLDMEVRWFGDHFGTHDRLLAPGKDALHRTEKPAVEAFSKALGFNVPEYISSELPESEIHSFLRKTAWQCWLKSPFHDAKRISNWPAFDRSRRAMSKAWKTNDLFIQRNVAGNEESICFAAYQGELLGAIYMQKRLLTPEGKTWAGRVTPVTGAFLDRFKAVIREMNWTGGGEIEYVTDPDGCRWIIECNPRFPAWIYGAALVGVNLPGRLIARVLSLPLLEKLEPFPFFTRVVQEIPAKEAVGLPMPPDPSAFAWVADGGKKGAGGGHTLSLPTLANTIKDDEEEDHEECVPDAPGPMLEEVREIVDSFRGETPERVHLDKWTARRFDLLARKVAASRGQLPEIRIGYSIKTSPTRMHLEKALGSSFYAECISQREARLALETGFKESQIILNGPGKFWPLTDKPIHGLHQLFCDSVEEFDRVIAMRGISEAVGFRMKLPDLHSRFGNGLDEFERFHAIVGRVEKLDRKIALGFHFHMPSWHIGTETWLEALSSLTLWCQAIGRVTDVPVRRLDLGGGFFPQDLEKLDFKFIQGAVRKELPQVEAVYFEPGRSLTQDAEVVVSRVLDVRRKSSGAVTEVVVDACIAELPLINSYSHRIFYKGRQVRKGSTRILGRICMEDDILSPGVNLGSNIEIGDLITFGDAGAYERTMSYAFGRG